MKKLILILVVLALALNLNAQDSNKFRIEELVILPHPGKIIKMNAEEIGVTKEEKLRIEKEVKAIFAPIFQEKIRAAFEIEQKVKREVAKGATKEDLKADLDKISRLKREAINSRIDALNTTKNILGDKKWNKLLNIHFNKK